MRGGKQPHPFNTVRVEDPGLIADLQNARVRFQGELPNTWLSTLLSWVVPMLLFFGLWSFLIKRVGGQTGFAKINV